MQKSAIRHLTVLAVALASIQSHAALHDRGGGLIYDDVLNLTWLQDADFARTSGYDLDGQMSWDDAAAWAAGLAYRDNVRGVDYSDWRLPNFLIDLGEPGCVAIDRVGGTDCGYKPPPFTSELATMYYQSLGNNGLPDANPGLVNTGPFINLTSNLEGYWSQTEHVLNPTDEAWAFGTRDGHQDPHLKSIRLNAWAVRMGDVAPIPEPGSLLLMVSGLAAMGVWSSRREKKG